MPEERLPMQFRDHHFPWREQEGHADQAAWEAAQQLEFSIRFPEPVAAALYRNGDVAAEVLSRPAGKTQPEHICARVLLRHDADGRGAYVPQATAAGGQHMYLRRYPGNEERYARTPYSPEASICPTLHKAVHVLWNWIRSSGLELEAQRREYDGRVREDQERCRRDWPVWDSGQPRAEE